MNPQPTTVRNGVSMIPTDPPAQAALILATGRLLRDRTLRRQSAPAGRGKTRPPLAELSMAQSLAMLAVKERGPLSITALARLLAVSAPSASTMVERLVERGILMREPDPRDRRRVNVRLTVQADATYDRIHHFILQDFVGLVERLGPDTTRKWCEVMVEVRKALLDPSIPQEPPLG
jgi:DNA-binding MarR family transcriptional regulator